MRLPFLVACLVAVSTCAAQSPDLPQTQGRIGSVINDKNEPIASAILCTSIVGANSGSTSCGQKADREGHFDLRVPLDTNRVFAQKPESGYQQANQQPDSGVHVKLTETRPVAHVTIKIGPQPAEIDLTVTDKTTGKPVDSYTVRWTRIDDGAVMFVESTKNHIFVPPDVDLLLIVQSQGYERWFYSDVTAPSRPILRLSSGEQRAVDAELERR